MPSASAVMAPRSTPDFYCIGQIAELWPATAVNRRAGRTGVFGPCWGRSHRGGVARHGCLQSIRHVRAPRDGATMSRRHIQCGRQRASWHAIRSGRYQPAKNRKPGFMAQCCEHDGGLRFFHYFQNNQNISWAQDRAWILRCPTCCSPCNAPSEPIAIGRGSRLFSHVTLTISPAHAAMRPRSRARAWRFRRLRKAKMTGTCRELC